MIDLASPQRAMLDLIQKAENLTGIEHLHARDEVLARAEMIGKEVLGLGRHPDLQEEITELHTKCGYSFAVIGEMYKGQMQAFAIYQSIETFRESQRRLRNEIFADET